MALGLGLVSAALWAAGAEKAAPKPPAAAPRPSAESVAEAVRDLASPDPAARRRAQELLLRAGPAALGALQAAESSDAEVVNQIARLVVAIRYGLDDKTPKAVVELVNKYRSGDAEAAVEAVEKLAAEGEAGQRVLRAIAASTTTTEREKAGGDEAPEKPLAGFGERVYQRLPDLATARRFDELEALLRIAAAGGGDDRVCDLVAFHLIRGTLDAELARAEDALALHAGQKGTPLASKAARLLAYLYRAKGMTEKARDTAVRWGLDDLADGLAGELGRWQDIKEFHMGLAEHPDDIGVLGRVAAYHRLLGNRKLFEAMIARIRAYAGNGPHNAWPAAKALVFNRRVEDALDVLLRHGNYQSAVGMLEQRHEFARAVEAAEKAMAAGGQAGAWAEVWLAAFGVKREGRDKGRAALAEVARRAAERDDWGRILSVVDQERKLGFTKEAVEHAAAALAAVQKQGKEKVDQQQGTDACLNTLFAARGKEAAALWPFLRQEVPGEGGREAVAGLHELLGGKLAGHALDALLLKADAFAAPLEPEPRAAFLDAVAEACALHGRAEQAIEWFDKRCKASPAAAPLMRIAELRAGQEKWEEAARVFGRAWEADRDNPAPLYLQGWALGKMGREAEGRAKRDLARLLPLGRRDVRRELAHALGAHGLKNEGIEEQGLILLTDPVTLHMAGDTLSCRGDHAHGLKDYARAALLLERLTLPVYNQGWFIVENDEYLGIPARTQLSRAHARLAEGKIEQAMEEARLGLDVLPGYTDLPLALVPELEKAGRVKEADELFGRVYDTLDKACQVCPFSAATHNSLAWLAARCRRRLDAALEHTRRAVELEPDCAWFVDTLAEVHFQRGELDKAVEVGQRALELGKDKYYREQLDRFRSARDGRKGPQ